MKPLELLAAATVLAAMVVLCAVALVTGSEPKKPCCQCGGECCQGEAQALTFPPRAGDYLILPNGAVDGDTFNFYWLVKDSGRLHGINAPEARAPGGKEAKEFLQKMLPTGPAKVKVHGREKYGRALLDLYLGDGVTASKKMIDAKHAKPWDGKGERP